MPMRSLLLVIVIVATAAGLRAADAPAAECGRGLSIDDVRAGWISLFDGASSFGWTGATFSGLERSLAGGATSVPFRDYDVRADVLDPGRVGVGRDGTMSLASEMTVEGQGAGPVRFAPGVSVRGLCVRPILSPLAVTPETWKVIPHPSLSAERQTRWEPITRDGKSVGVRAVGGPGCLELPGEYGDFVLQLEVNCRAPRSNAGVFFRSRPGDFLNGYEVQILNPRDGEARRPKYVTGAIDDRQPARRAVARDGEPFVLTIVAAGPKMATWVNGVQVVDWTDTRPAHDNPRRGLRLEPGTIQLQAHDRDTDVEVTNIRVAPMARP